MNEDTLQVIREHIRSNKEQYAAMGSVDSTDSSDGE